MFLGLNDQKDPYYISSFTEYLYVHNDKRQSFIHFKEMAVLIVFFLRAHRHLIKNIFVFREPVDI